MPVQQIAVVSQSKQSTEITSVGMSTEDECRVTVDDSNGAEGLARDGDTVLDTVSSHENPLMDNPVVVADSCGDRDHNEHVNVGENVDSTDNDVNATHIEADTVIIGDTNSDCTSDSAGRQTVDETGAESGNIDLSNNACLAQNEKRANTRNGKSNKKEKLASIKKKDSNTQETLHPNSPTPISAERCDSSMSNVDVCRICQCDTCEIQKESALVSPCLCSGSLKFVHQACLQKWIKSSNKMSCELCHFDYQMTRKTKPFREWERLDMTQAEKRKVVCSVTFHVIAITCVVWSLYVLIDRTTEEVEAGSLQWPFWTKLIVVAIGFTGGVVFMYVQCKLYLTLCKKWRTYNKVILVSSISESTREKANHEGILKITEKQAQLEEERRTNFDVFTIVHESESF